MSDMTKRFGLSWLIPMKLVLRQKFNSLEKMKSIQMPVLIITGTDDIQIPIDMGRRLYQAAPEYKELLIIKGQHCDWICSLTESIPRSQGHDNHLSERDKQHVKQFIEPIVQSNI